jgi:hypothetical protein
MTECITLAFGCEPRRMFIINQRFGKHFNCHLQGECVVKRVLEALHRADSGWWVRFDGDDWWNGEAGCYPRLLELASLHSHPEDGSCNVCRKHWLIRDIRSSSSLKAEVIHWNPAAKIQGQTEISATHQVTLSSCLGFMKDGGIIDEVNIRLDDLVCK